MVSQLFMAPSNPKRNPPRKYFLGVNHTTWNFFGPTQSMRHLNAHLKKLAAEGIHRVGIESLEGKRPGSNRKRDANFRYFYGVKLLLERRGMKVEQVDDPNAIELHRWLDIWADYEPNTLSSGRATLFLFQHYLGKHLEFRDFVELGAALGFLRTRIMLRNARKRDLQAVIAGENHADHVNSNDFEVISVDRPFIADSFRSLREKNEKEIAFAEKCYKKYGRVLMRILRDIKNKKMFLEPVPTPEELPKRW